MILNLAAISFDSAAILGLEHTITGRPNLFVAFMIFHIVLCLFVIGWFAKAQWRNTSEVST